MPKFIIDNIKVEEFTFPSYSGLCDIYAKKFVPKKKSDEKKLKGIVQIAHGMAEHSGRYTDFAKYLVKSGYCVYINDHVGHGKSIKSNDMLGYFGNEHGYESFIYDCKNLTDIAKSEYPNLPFFILGHSMGSFIARLYSYKFSEDIDGAIFMGTAGSNPALPAGFAVTNLVIKTKGKMHRSNLINNIGFSSYNRKTKKRTDFDWLTNDTKVVDQYIMDPFCGIKFTAQGYKDLFTLLKIISQNDWYQGLKYNLPILIMSGMDDPVGSYGKGPKEVHKRLQEANHKNLETKLYTGCRHEIHNDIKKDIVMDDLVQWLDNYSVY